MINWMNILQKNMCWKKIGLRVQNLLVILDAIVNMIFLFFFWGGGETYVNITERIFISIMD